MNTSKRRKPYLKPKNLKTPQNSSRYFVHLYFAFLFIFSFLLTLFYFYRVNHSMMVLSHKSYIKFFPLSRINKPHVKMKEKSIAAKAVAIFISSYIISIFLNRSWQTHIHTQSAELAKVEIKLIFFFIIPAGWNIRQQIQRLHTTFMRYWNENTNNLWRR